MNKHELVEAVQKLTGHSGKDTKETVDAVLQVMIHTVASGEAVRLTGLGSLSLYMVPGWEARNPRNGEPVDVPDKYRVKFRPARRLTAYVNGTIAVPATPGEVRVKEPRGTT